MHNVGQLSAACFILGDSAVLAYMPVLIISGCIAGTVTGLCLGLLMPVLTKNQTKMREEMMKKTKRSPFKTP